MDPTADIAKITFYIADAANRLRAAPRQGRCPGADAGLGARRSARVRLPARSAHRPAAAFSSRWRAAALVCRLSAALQSRVTEHGNAGFSFHQEVAEGCVYNRTAHLPERRKMTLEWANYLYGLRNGLQDAEVKPPG
jgi:hypothetical protein